MRKILLLIAIICQGAIQAQNLVPNCSFEDTIFCPDHLGQIYACKNWFSTGAIQSSPDYFKACGEHPSVPYNNLGFHYAASGNAYTGIIPWLKDESVYVQDQKEFIGTELIEPLVIGKNYYVSFKTSLELDNAYCYASNKTGILFSTIKYDNANPAPVKNFAHVYTNKIITDTLNWTTIKGWFTADSAYRYISIGDFFDNTHTDTIQFNSCISANNYASYYYIDDVCVSTDSVYNENWTGIANIKEMGNLKIFPNPINEGYLNITNIENSQADINLYNAIGKVVFNIKKTPTNNRVLINLSSIVNGCYIISIENKNEKFNSLLIINH